MTSAPSDQIVSIGMPVYNGQAFIEEAIQSIRRQTETRWELLISDNASTDRTGEICARQSAEDPRIRYVVQPENIGAIRNFGYVLSNTAAPFFMWAASDDVWDESWLAILLGAMEANPGSCAFGRIEHIDENGKPVEHIANGRTFSYASRNPLGRRVKFFLEPEAQGKANTIYALYPRAVLKEYFPTFQRGYAYGDCVAVWRMLQRSRLLACENTYLGKRLHAGAASGAVARGERSLRGYLQEKYFSFATKTSLRGITDYFRCEQSFASLICLLMTPLKVLMSFIKLRQVLRQKAG
jgi:glycosyltransferase involved in cell wall biosynthesis